MKSRGRSHGLLNSTSEGFDALYHFADDAVARKGMSIMRYSQPLLAGIAAVGLIMLSGPSAQSQRQKMPVAAAAAANQTQPPPLKCTPAASPDPFLPDPFKFRLAGDFPAGLLPIDDNVKDSIMKSGLPCQENVRPNIGQETEGLENLQRGFDFYSWRTFIALNSPADGRGIDQSMPNTKTKWEDRANFKQLLDVMLPDGVASEWTDKKQPPPGCKSQFEANPDMMVIEMIEETFNQPFKTGALIDQQGNYALFDILMNRQMFDYIRTHKLYSKTEQMNAANSNLKIDFPAGANPPDGQIEGGDPGGIIVKVSWKILESDQEKRKFHTVDALVSMPRDDPNTEPPCLRKTLGLVGFHVMHKTKSRLQWIWTSFEHVDNVPEKKEVDTRKLKQ